MSFHSLGILSFKAVKPVGWIELGNQLEANEELEHSTPQNRAHPDVLQVRWNTAKVLPVYLRRQNSEIVFTARLG